jgi:hypothetical protein
VSDVESPRRRSTREWDFFPDPELTMKKFLAVYLGSQSSPNFTAWNALPAGEREARHKAGVAAWHAWVDKHRPAILDDGGPLGKTKAVSAKGIGDARNLLTGYTVVQAESHEAAARMFENHPHFAMMPGDGVEVVEILAIPAI